LREYFRCILLQKLKDRFNDPAALNANNVEPIPAEELGDEGFGWHATEVGRNVGFRGSWEGSEYAYAWRTGKLLQVFDLVLSGPGVSEDTDTAHRFAAMMASQSASGC
jgi:hypothetical protein